MFVYENIGRWCANIYNVHMYSSLDEQMRGISQFMYTFLQLYVFPLAHDIEKSRIYELMSAQHP